MRFRKYVGTTCLNVSFPDQLYSLLVFLFISGLNLQSQFNLDNVTVFNKNEQESTLGQKVNNLKSHLDSIG